MSADHDHPHPNDDVPRTDSQLLEAALRELLIKKKIFSSADMRAVIEMMDARTPALGAKVVARAWVDPAFKGRLLADGSAALRELDIDPGSMKLVVIENTPEAHNMVVCTLCSCYPRMLLGLPPDWYKSTEYRARAVREPRALLAEFGTPVRDDVQVRVHDSTADMRYLVLPERPSGTERMSEEELASLVSRDAMIGVTRAAEPQSV